MPVTELRENSTRTVNAWAAMIAKGKIEPIQYVAPPLGYQDIEIKITHCGLCHSDLALMDEDWDDASVFPQICGHEIVGVVTEVGDGVKHLAMGQRVGIGWQKASCLECEWCLRGKEQLCPFMVSTCCYGERGGFADYLRCDSRFAFMIPDALPSEMAAPLLCAGITVYAPLAMHAKPGTQVGVVGIGGLGHLALQFANKRGCQVTALSSGAAKEVDAKRFGANKFLVHTDSAAMAAAVNTLDYILVTTGSPCDWGQLFELLRPQGTICFAGIVMTPVDVSIYNMSYKELNVSTTLTGGRQDMIDMLQFAADYGIEPQIEVMPMSQINQAVDRLKRNAVRYRIVLEH